MNDKLCHSCLYWQNVRKGLGECHHRSPGISDDGTDRAVWPNTHDWEGCGDWKPKSKSDADDIKPRYLYINLETNNVQARSYSRNSDTHNVSMGYYKVVDMQEHKILKQIIRVSGDKDAEWVDL